MGTNESKRNKYCISSELDSNDEAVNVKLKVPVKKVLVKKEIPVDRLVHIIKYVDRPVPITRYVEKPVHIIRYIEKPIIIEKMVPVYVDCVYRACY